MTRSHRPFRRRIALAVTAWIGACATSGPALADGEAPGTFAFYVLALSWAPSYCRDAGRDASPRECGPHTGYGFVVHGLWPQNEHGYPAFCPTTLPDHVPKTLAERMTDLTPDVALIEHEWRKHGTCTGLDQQAYFALVRKARANVAIPRAFASPAPARSADPANVEAAFRMANPGLPSTGIAVTCRNARLSEVRICLTWSLAFRACPEVDANGCNTSRLRLPAAD
ncbi:ribonuclease T2 [Pararhizobium mangrovi]|uniref:ribonuclease T2 n=1 Tax=Pararhizobium mangrovi TaxID=2590452 RepID=UPI001F28307C|nr:ribonuclease T2 [Pararhizobium mangrovi]